MTMTRPIDPMAGILTISLPGGQAGIDGSTDSGKIGLAAPGLHWRRD